MTKEQVVQMLDALIQIINAAPPGFTFKEALALTKYLAIKEWGND